MSVMGNGMKNSYITAQKCLMTKIFDKVKL